MTKQIPVSGNRYAIVDDEDYESLLPFKWRGQVHGNTCYAIRHVRRGLKRTTVKMHREILNAPAGMVVDHINHNGLDNRKSNLRICTQGDNARNYHKPYTNKSGYKGVIFNKFHKRWQAQIYFNGKNNHIGYFDTAIEGARAYDAKAIELHGAFASTNF